MLEAKLRVQRDGSLALPDTFLQEDYDEWFAAEVSLVTDTAKTIKTNITSIKFLCVIVDEDAPANVAIVKDSEATDWTVSGLFLAFGIDTCGEIELTADADTTAHIFIGG